MAFPDREDHAHDPVLPGEREQLALGAVDGDAHRAVVPNKRRMGAGSRRGKMLFTGRRAEQFVRKVAVGGLLGLNGMSCKPEPGAWNRKVAIQPLLPRAHVLQDSLFHLGGHGIVHMCGERCKEVNGGKAMQLPVHPLRKSGLAPWKENGLEHPPGIHQVVVGCRWNRPAGVRVVHCGLRQEVGTALDIRRMEDAVVFEREVRMKVRRGDPFLDRPPVHDAGVPQIARNGQRVHHVFDGLLVPRCGMGM